MNLPPDIIAGSLSDPQREALIAFCSRKNSPWGYYAADLGATGAVCAALERKGLLTGGNIHGQRTRSYRWTSLGAEVFALLASVDGRRMAETAQQAPGGARPARSPEGGDAQAQPPSKDYQA